MKPVKKYGVGVLYDPEVGSNIWFGTGWFFM